MTTIATQAIQAARAVALIGTQARQQFIDRDAAIEAIEWAIACGEHAIVLGPPGTGKSAVTRFFADGLGAAFFRKLLNPDTTRDELVGPIDPLAIDQGRWDRRWSGMATAEFCFLDEVGKASSQVMNMTLDAMEERLVTSGDQDRPIPLHTVVGASNETLGDELAAVWDRFTIRLVVRRLNESSKIAAMLTRKRGNRQDAESNGAFQPGWSMGLTGDDLVAMRKQAKWMAENPSDEVVATVVKLWSKISTITSEKVSDRRWERLLTVAAGRALIQGRDAIDPSDLIVAKHMLWEVPSDIDKIEAFVVAIVDEEQAEIAAKTRLVEELETLRSDAQASATTSIGEATERKARISHRAGRLLRELTGKNGKRPEWANLRSRLEALQDWALGD